MFFAFRLWLGQRLYGVIGDPNFPAGYRISARRVVKWPCDAPELEGHRYAAVNTSLPVPKIHRVRKWRGRMAIEMEYLSGCQTIQECWRSLSKEEKEKIVQQVSEYIQQLHALEPPPELRGKIGATDGGACRDVRVGSTKLFGPFDDVAGFHRCLRGGVEADSAQEIFGEKVADIHSRNQYRIRFTHGDLGVQNILIRDGSVVAILDWECSGWYPEYWEYTKAHYNSVLLPEFYEMLRERIPRYDEELAAEQALWRCFDQPLDAPPTAPP